MTQYKTFNTRNEADQVSEAVMRAYCTSLQKPFPEPIEFFTAGRRPQRLEAYYQRNYVAQRDAGEGGIAQLHLPVDAFVRSLHGVRVVIADAVEVVLDFSVLIEVPDLVVGEP
jgi:hypothetical protein